MTLAVCVPAMVLKLELVEYSNLTAPGKILRAHKTVEVWVVSPLAIPFTGKGAASLATF